MPLFGVIRISNFFPAKICRLQLLSSYKYMTIPYNLCSVGNIHKIQYLLNHGTNVNQTDFEGKTALMHW